MKHFLQENEIINSKFRSYMGLLVRYDCFQTCNISHLMINFEAMIPNSNLKNFLKCNLKTEVFKTEAESKTKR